ncbi:hypothetical protein EVAR_93511_1 [Eumeta japonica]|uniref:Uncharacterized protein n=1 Tax=Eumeta variegata TaxID=151549 RepID=A0A4C1TMP6_EUMVA|nr:hypothetical protein EVAR_93511_1 [Eumeta japonica]
MCSAIVQQLRVPHNAQIDAAAPLHCARNSCRASQRPPRALRRPVCTGGPRPARTRAQCHRALMFTPACYLYGRLYDPADVTATSSADR